jgi:hypothetical protein
VCSSPLVVSSTNLSSSPLLNSLGDALAQSQGEMAQANCSYVNTRPLMAKLQSIDDAANTPTASFVFVQKPLTNSQKLQKFRSDWGRNAIASGQISPAYLDTYRSILSIPLLPDNVSKEEYDGYVDRLAYMIKAWYVTARYAGDLAPLALAIDRDRPQWSPPPVTGSASASASAGSASEGFCGSRWHLNETTLFGLIVGLGLAGICFWKACK